MGSLIGHIVPGLFFIIFSTWWILNIFSRYFKCYFEEKTAGKCKVPYKSSTSFLWKRTSEHKGIPLESWIKISAVIIGITGEFVTGFNANGRFELHNGQHMAMFGFFAFNSILELMYYHKVPALPPQLDYVSIILAFAIEGLIFQWHLEGRKPIDHQVHSFLIYVIVFCCISGFAEMANPKDVRAALGRSAFTFLQGSWFIHLGFILYPPSSMEVWNLEGDRNSMLVTILFVCHVATAFVLLLVAGWMIYRREKLKYFSKYAFVSKEDLEGKLLESGNLPKLLIDSDTDDSATA